jgi:hypothetical protein
VAVNVVICPDCVGFGVALSNVDDCVCASARTGQRRSEAMASFVGMA